MEITARLLIMKTACLTTSLLLGIAQFSVAGGNSSLVELDRVISIKIEKEKVTIIGDGIIRKRVISDQQEEGLRSHAHFG
jgi:hypothetical protein